MNLFHPMINLRLMTSSYPSLEFKSTKNEEKKKGERKIQNNIALNDDRPTIRICRPAVSKILIVIYMFARDKEKSLSVFEC